MYFLFFKGALAQNNGNCDFENPSGLCGYTQDTTDDFDWTRKHGSTSSSGTGPTTDHTTSTGLNVPGKHKAQIKNICIALSNLRSTCKKVTSRTRYKLLT